MRRQRYSIHEIASTGAPTPVDAARRLAQALDKADTKARTKGLEVRVWDTRRAKVIYTAPAGGVA